MFAFSYKLHLAQNFATLFGYLSLGFTLFDEQVSKRVHKNHHMCRVYVQKT